MSKHNQPNRCRRVAGFALLELSIAIAAFVVVFGAASVTVSGAVRTSLAAMSATEKSIQNRRILDEIEGILSAASASSLDMIPESQGFFALLAFYGDQQNGTQNIADYMLPLTDEGASIIAFRVPFTDESGGLQYKPESYWSFLYLEKGESLYELKYYDGVQTRTICRDLEGGSFRYANGRLYVTLQRVVDKNDDYEGADQQDPNQQDQQGEYIIEEEQRLILIRLP